MRVVFDFGIWDGPAYGIAYAVLEQMRALQKLGVPVKNLTIGRPCAQHKQLLKAYGLASLNIPLPRSVVAPAPVFLKNMETALLGRNIFYQIGIHAFHQLPAEKYIVAMHDVISLKYPEKEAPLPAYTKDLLEAAGIIVTVSEFSKKEIAQAFQLDHKKIKVIYNGCNQQRFNLQKNEEVFLTIAKHYQLPEKYILAYGGNAPRKNFQRLCEAYEKLKTNIPLVIFGGFQYHGKARIKTLGYVPEETVAEILKHAHAFILPSYYEGFGLPIIEAMACGIPVACAKASALPEISGGHALFFDPFSITDMAAGLHDIMTNELLRQRCILNGQVWAGEFTWEKSAKKFYEIIK